MIRRFFVAFSILMAIIAVAGCGMSKTIVAKQEWSDNYALEEGVNATSPLMVDGNLSTTGETENLASSTGTRGITNYTEAIVEFPEKKSIRRVDIYTDNIESMSLHAAGRDEGTWILLEEVKNNKDKMLSFKVSTITDKIKVRVRKTTDDQLQPGGRGRNRNRMQRAKGRIQEIEIYGLAPVQEEPEMAAEETDFTGVDEGFTAAKVVETKQPVDVDTSSASIVPTKKEEVTTILKPETTTAETKVVKQVAPKPEVPPAAMKLESPQSTYALAGPIPAKIIIKIGPEDLVVLEDQMTDGMLATKLLVKTASGEQIACSKPTPPLSRPRPYRSSGGEVSVRDARTLDADSLVTMDIANLLEYYPITEPGSYTVQFDMKLNTYSTFVGRNQTQIQDIERTMREINSRSNYSQTERATLMSSLQEDIDRLEKDKSNRYIVIGSKGKSLALKSNVLELTIQ